MSPERHTIGLIEDDPIMGESLVQRLILEGADVKLLARQTRVSFATLPSTIATF
jgi:hypothetical protein